MIKLNSKKNSRTGFGLIEIVVAVAIISISFFALAGVSQIALRVVHKSTEETRANFLLEEGIEIVRLLRDETWTGNIDSLSVSTVYYPVYNTGLNEWQLSTTNPGAIDGIFTRTISFANVYRRDSDDDIVDPASPDPKTVDGGTREVTITVSWGSTEVVSITISVSFEGGTTDGNLAGFPSDNAGNGDPAQSFTTLANAIKVPKVELYMKRATANPSDVYLEIRSGSTVGAVIATSQTMDSATLPASLSWVTFTFPTPPTLNPSTQYYLRLASTPPSTDAWSGSQGTIHWGYLQSGSSPYAGGDAYRYVGRLSNPGDTGQILTQYDFAFRVYEETTSGSPGRSIDIVTYIADIFQN